MEFCPKCSSVMMIDGKRLKCRACGYTKVIGKDVKTKVCEKVDVKDEIIIVEEDEEKRMYPKTKMMCPNCGHMEAIWWMQQTRAADEPPTMFFKCTKCGHTWREY